MKKLILVLIFLSFAIVAFSQLEYIGISYNEFREKYIEDFPFSYGYKYGGYFIHESEQDSLIARFYFKDNISGIDFKFINPEDKAANYLEAIDTSSIVLGQNLRFTYNGLLIHYKMEADTLLIQIRDMFHVYKIDSEPKDTL